ncbi:MAG: type II and III secretion system protein [Acidobacteriia bacterium]|nr:type II and III secretion system protein [Terriglobia bacterium]
MAAQPDGATFLEQDARAAEKSGDVVRAYLLYSQAAALNPKNQKPWGKSLALRTQAITKAKVLPAGEAGALGAEEFDLVADEDVVEARKAHPPPSLKPNPGRRRFDLKGDSKALAEQVLRDFGIEAIFDHDYQPLNNLRFRVESVEAGEALEALQAATASFLVPVSERMALVARDTSQKRQELEYTIAVTVPLPHPVTTQAAQELARAVQQTMEIQKFGIDTVRNLIFIRDRASKVGPALALFQQLLTHRAEVDLEVEYLEISSNATLDIGLKLPASLNLSAMEKMIKAVPLPNSLAGLLKFGMGHTFFGLGIADVAAFATFSESSSRTLLKAQMRSSEGQPVTFHQGDKYPVITQGYYGASSPGDQIYAPPPTFRFEDLGVVIKITPRVHSPTEVSLDVDAEFKVLTGQALNGIPVIANRKFISTVRLRTGEVAVVAGLVRGSESRTINGIAGVSTLPVIGVALRSNNKSKESGETLFVIRPRILGMPSSDVLTHSLWTGSETRPRLPL